MVCATQHYCNFIHAILGRLFGLVSISCEFTVLTQKMIILLIGMTLRRAYTSRPLMSQNCCYDNVSVRSAIWRYQLLNYLLSDCGSNANTILTVKETPGVWRCPRNSNITWYGLPSESNGFSRGPSATFAPN